MHWSTDSRRVQAKTAIHPPHSEQPVKAVVPKQLANKPALVNCLGHDGEQAANTADSRIVIKTFRTSKQAPEVPKFRTQLIVQPASSGPQVSRSHPRVVGRIRIHCGTTLFDRIET